MRGSVIVNGGTLKRMRMVIPSCTALQGCSLKRLIRPVLFVSLVLNLFFFVVLFTPCVEELYKPLIVDEEPRTSDVIVVLSAGAYDSGLPDFATLVRLRKGLELQRQKYAGRIICAGGIRPGESKKSIAEIMKETLILHGVPADRVFVQDETINTYNDISYLIKKFGADFDFDKSIFVTSAYHTYRVKKILRRKNIHARVVSAAPYQLTPKKWYERLGLLMDVAREYSAILYFKAAGYI